MREPPPFALGDRRTESTTPETPEERRAGADRRRKRRIPMSLDVAVPVMLRGDHGLVRGLARNMSEGGILLEVSEVLPIGSRVQITIAGVRGSLDAPDSVTFHGEVRHQLSWQYSTPTGAKRMRGIGIRFLEPEDVEEVGAPSWVFDTGTTVH